MEQLLGQTIDELPTEMQVGFFFCKSLFKEVLNSEVSERDQFLCAKSRNGDLDQALCYLIQTNLIA
jgi:hypothetical protein